MQFHFVRIIHTKGYFTLIDPVGKTRTLCFQTDGVADKYVKYMSKFRSVNGVWPKLDMTQKLSVVRPVKMKKRTPEDVERFMDVTCLNREELDDLGRVHGMSFFYVIDFATDGLGVNFQGQEIDAIPDPSDFTKNLELLIE
jgi:hypothetical protein